MDQSLQQYAARPSDERPKRLVVVADGDAAHLYYTSMLLQRMDYNIHTSKTAADVLEIVDVANPALVLTSIVLLGDMTGIELLQTLKRSPRTYRIPVIMLTGSRDPAAKEACAQAKCADLFCPYFAF
jgi:CheY-like chemotaxis protein